MSHEASSTPLDVAGIAIIGMSCRVPGAADCEAFWRNLRDGIESISFFEDAEVETAGASRRSDRGAYVNAGGLLDGIDLFDADFFGFSPRQAQLLDPQHRIFLECAWEALESAGYLGEPDDAIGVYAGAGMNAYLLNNLLRHGGLIESAGGFQIQIDNDKDFLATRVSYKLDLKGPSINVQTACSTSLVAVHLACQALNGGECDIALAGGVTLNIPQRTGYLYQEDMIYSRDGHCRAFDAESSGTVAGSGCGIVVLKRFEEAVADGDTILAVIRGSAINNDGAVKVGYTAPGLEGQAAVIAEAIAVAGVEARSISYVEAHGTATKLGDAVEIAALNKAFRRSTEEQGFCGIGSVKTNIGHLDTAAGVAGLIKTTLALDRKFLPPSLHFEAPNPQIDFAGSPFYVNASLAPWQAASSPRRAGVSSFGIGGTNVHLVLEEAPPRAPSVPSQPWQLLTLAAKTPRALEAASARLADYCDSHPDVELGDLASTLQVGRQHFSHRRVLVSRDARQARDLLRKKDRNRLIDGHHEAPSGPLVFVFPGQGTQLVGMGAELYRTEAVFRQQVDECCEMLRPHLEADLRETLFPSQENRDTAARQMGRTAVAQPALFVFEYALARLWMSWGFQPAAMIGHSLGEYVAACLAGVLTLRDALSLVSARGRWMQALPPGAMVSLALPENAAAGYLGETLSLAAVNAPSQSVLSGPVDAVAELIRVLGEAGVETRQLETARAFHSSMMEPILQPFLEEVGKVRLSPPQIPYVTGAGGHWITDRQAMDPQHWLRQLREPVRFADGIRTLLSDGPKVFLEVGPGRTLSSLVLASPQKPPRQAVVASLGAKRAFGHERPAILTALGELWLNGLQPDWQRTHQQPRRRLALPTYPFERRRFWIEASPSRDPEPSPAEATSNAEGRPVFLVPGWARGGPRAPRPPPPPRAAGGGGGGGAPPPRLPAAPTEGACLVCGDHGELTEALVAELLRRGLAVTSVVRGEAFAAQGDRAFSLDPALPEAFDTLMDHLASIGADIARVVYLWSLRGDLQDFDELMALRESLRKRSRSKVQLLVVTDNGCEVTGEEDVRPESALLHGFVPSSPQAVDVAVYTDTDTDTDLRCLDVVLPGTSSAGCGKLAAQIATELTADHANPEVAYRGGFRWLPSVHRLALPETARPSTTRDTPGTYLICDAATILGATLARELADRGAKLILIHDAARPPAQPPPVSPRSILASAALDLARAGELEAFVRREAAQVALTGVFFTVDTLIVDTLTGDTLTADTASTSGAPLGRALGVARALYDVLGGGPIEFLAALASGGSGVQPDGIAFRALGAFLGAWVRRYEKAFATPALFLSAPHGWRGTAPSALELVEGALARGLTTVAWEGPLDDGAPPPLPAASDPPEAETGSAIRRELTRIWKELLGVRSVDGGDDFFKHGGDSLLATQFLARARESLRIELSLEEMFQRPTLEALERCIAEKSPSLAADGARQQDGVRQQVGSQHRDAHESAAPAMPALPPLRPRPDRASHLPLSFAQQRLWFLHQLEQTSVAYNIPATFYLEGALDIHLMKSAVREMVQRHQIFRTAFENDDGTPRQAIKAAVEVPFWVVDLGALAESRGKGLSFRLAQQEATRPFVLTTAPLLRCTLLRWSDRAHVLLVTMHHIISDTWSLGIFIRELATLYDAKRNDAPNPLPDLPVQYADFTLWQRQWLTGDVLESQLSYWQSQLRSAPPLLKLAYDRPRPALQQFDGRAHAFQIPPEVGAKIKGLSQEAGTTLYMTLLAAFATLITRHAESRDVVIGTPIANRKAREAEYLIGFFANTLAIRLRLGGKPTFRALLSYVREVTLAAYAHQDLPFERLVEALQPERNPSYSPIFQVSFSFQNAPLDDLRLPGLAVRSVATEHTTSKFDLSLELMEAPQGGLTGAFEYSDRLFEAATIQRLSRHFLCLLDAATATPQLPVEALAILTPGERQQLLAEWAGEAAELGPEENVAQQLSAQVHRTPDAVALSCGDHHLTYRCLERRSQALARRLRARFRQLHGAPLAGDVPIALCLERGPDMVVAILAVLAAGGAYVPLDPDHPAERLAALLGEIQPPVLLTRSDLFDRAPAVEGVERMYLDDAEVGAGQDPDEPLPPVLAGCLAYVIYTSGSSGKPKGVMLTHRSLVNRLRWMRRTFPMAGDDVFLFKSPYVFDWSFAEIFLPLTSGAQLTIADPEGHRDAGYLIALIERRRVGHLHFVPSMLAVFLEATERPGEADRCRALRHVYLSGEAVALASSRLFRQLFSARLHNLYGPTEVGEVSHVPCPPVHRYPCAIEPIGRPIANGFFYTLDRAQQPVAIGVPGELYQGGAVLARGYYRRPALTAERFVPHPFARHPGERLYRSGDLVRWLPDGNTEFLGRIDFQVKIRGQRVEPAEIEAVLDAHPAVARCQVLALQRGDEHYLAAYYTVQPGALSSEAQLRDHLSRSLTSAMIPEAFVALEAFPLTGNGKVDRRQLPAPDAPRGGEATAPRDEIERRLLRLFQEILDDPSLGVEDDFFIAGGHSLLAARWILRINAAFGSSYPLAWVFRFPSVAQQAAEIRRQGDAGDFQAVVRFHPAASGDPLWLIRPADADAEAYGALIAQLGPEVPVAVLEPYNLYSGEAVLDDPLALADVYLDHLRAEQPAGPYRLGGWSVGGALAYELAQRLRRAGEIVEHVYLIDTIALELGFDMSREEIYRRKAQLFPENTFDALPAPQRERIVDASHADGLCMERYQPQPYPGPVTLFRARRRLRLDAASSPPEHRQRLLDFIAAVHGDPTNGWASHAPSLRVIELDATHRSILQGDHLQALAEVVRDDLLAVRKS